MRNPIKRWKLSPMDLESRKRWVEYSKAKDEMLSHTDREKTPWYVVNADDKKKARTQLHRASAAADPVSRHDTGRNRSSSTPGGHRV